MKFDRGLYKEYSPEAAREWGKKYYGNWLLQLHNQDYAPQTPIEQFFKYYTQGIHYVFNRILRDADVEKYNFEGIVSKAMFVNSIEEICKHRLDENIVVYRYVSKSLLKDMKKWSGIQLGLLKKNSILTDKGFFSTTLALDSVQGRHYATLSNHSLFTVYVPKGTPCVYVDLISDMNENEILFAPNIKLKVINSHGFGKFVECVVINEYES